MEKNEIRENAERYVELLSSYSGYTGVLNKVVKKINETRKELIFLEDLLDVLDELDIQEEQDQLQADVSSIAISVAIDFAPVPKLPLKIPISFSSPLNL